MKIRNVFMLVCALVWLIQTDGVAEKSVLAQKQKKENPGGLKPGDPSPDFRAVDVNGRPVFLKSLKGKYVYIDLWATWCGPCLGEVPHLQKLEKKMHDRKIVFVSISCDDDFGGWKEYVQENAMGGIQLNFDGNQRFQELYQVKSIPRFILLDKKGRIINADMTRPSNPKTGKTLEALKGI